MTNAKIFLCVALLAALPLRADEETKRAKIGELLESINARATIDQALKLVSESLRQGASQAAAQAAAGADSSKLTEEILTAAMDVAKRQLNWDDLKPEIIRHYAETFDEAEIDGLLAFYKSPVGKTYVAKLPELMKRSSELGLQRVQASLPEIMQVVKEKIEAYKKAHPKQ